MKTAAPVPLWIIGGFLGSGKTTLLNNVIRLLLPGPVGVLVNDFGTIGVDRALVEDALARAADGAHGRDGGRDADGLHGLTEPSVDGKAPVAGEAPPAVTVVDLNGGQIFCSCISGSFVDRIVDLTATDAKAIVVESSGLAKPGAMAPIIGAALSRSGGAFRYAGMVTVVDAPRFLRLEQIVNAVDEQVVYADTVVLNKIDGVNPATIAAVERRIRELNAPAKIITTSYGRIERAHLPAHPIRTGPTPDDAPDAPSAAGSSYHGWCNAKPTCSTWLPAPAVTPETLLMLVEERVQAGALRIKGFVPTAGGLRYVDVAGETISITSAEHAPAFGLTVFDRAQLTD